MRSRRIWFVLGLTALVAATCAIACSSFSSSNEPSPSGPDAADERPTIDGVPDGGGPVDAAPGDAATCDTTADFGTPVLVDGLDSSSSDSWLWLMPDELTIYWASSRDGSSPNHFYRATRPSRAAAFQNVTKITLTTTATLGPLFKPTFLGSESTAILAAGIPTLLYVAQKNGNGFDVYPAPGLNGAAVENTAPFWHDGELYLASSTNSPLGIVHMSVGPDGGATSQAVAIAELNVAGTNSQAPVPSPDNLTIYFASDRDAGVLNYEMYVSKRPSLSAPWGTPTKMNLGLNTFFYTAPEWVSADHCRLYFTSDRGTGFNRVFVAERGK